MPDPMREMRDTVKRFPNRCISSHITAFVDETADTLAQIDGTQDSRSKALGHETAALPAEPCDER